MKQVKSFDDFINESKTIEDITQEFIQDPIRTKFIIGSSTEGNHKADKNWVISQIENLINHYFFNEEYYDELDDKDKKIYLNKLEIFKKQSIKNFKDFFKSWMTVVSNNFRDEYQIVYNKRTSAKNHIRI